MTFVSLLGFSLSLKEQVTERGSFGAAKGQASFVRAAPPEAKRREEIQFGGDRRSDGCFRFWGLHRRGMDLGCEQLKFELRLVMRCNSA